MGLGSVIFSQPASAVIRDATYLESRVWAVVEERFDHVSQAGVFIRAFARGHEVFHMTNEIFFTCF